MEVARRSDSQSGGFRKRLRCCGAPVWAATYRQLPLLAGDSDQHRRCNGACVAQAANRDA